jgi:hypothetical protein
MVSIGAIRALAYRKGCSFDRAAAPARWRVQAGKGALSSAALAYREAYVLLMDLPDVRR